MNWDSSSTPPEARKNDRRYTPATRLSATASLNANSDNALGYYAFLNNGPQLMSIDELNALLNATRSSLP